MFGDNTLYVTGEDLGLPTPMTVDDTGSVTLQFRVVSVSKKEPDMETGAESDDVNYTLEVSVTSVEVDEVALKDALNRSMKEQTGASAVRVKTQVSPSPA